MQCIVFGLNDALRLSLAAINRRTRDNWPQVAQPLLHHEPQGARQRSLTHSAGCTQLTVTDVRSTTVLNRLLLISCALCSVVACKPLGAGCSISIKLGPVWKPHLARYTGIVNWKARFRGRQHVIRQRGCPQHRRQPARAGYLGRSDVRVVRQAKDRGRPRGRRRGPHEEVKARLLARKSQ